MKNWASAGDHIRRRSFPGLIASVQVETPFSFDPALSVSEMPDFLDANWEVLGGTHNTVISLPGRDVNFSRDCLISVSKFLHVLECARAQFDRGALTWMMVDAYHASFLGSRALCALLGVLSYTVKGRTVLVDFRPEFGTVDDVKRFQREHRHTDSPVRVLKPISRYLEQKDAWEMLKRICNVSERLEADNMALATLSEIAAQPLSYTRNQILYDSVFWQWREDFSHTTHTRATLANSVVSTGDTVDTAVSSLTKIFEVTKMLTDQFCGALGVSMAILGSMASLKATPNVLVS